MAVKFADSLKHQRVITLNGDGTMTWTCTMKDCAFAEDIAVGRQNLPVMFGRWNQHIMDAGHAFPLNF